MTQNRLYREVAHATGETVGVIRRLGFSEVIVPPRCHQSRPGSVQSSAKPPRNVASSSQHQKVA
jgi:hypothetical protein